MSISTAWSSFCFTSTVKYTYNCYSDCYKIQIYDRFQRISNWDKSKLLQIVSICIQTFSKMFFKLIPLACILVYCLSTVSGDCIGIYLPSGTCWGIPVRKLGHVLLKPLPCQFVFFDQDNDGFVTRNEFAHATRDHKVSLSAKTAVYQLLDTNSDDQIDKSEFLNNAKILQKKSVFKGCHI